MHDNKKERVLVFDTTLRDGEQAGHKLFADSKLAIAHQLADAGVDVIEAGFPISSSGDAVAVMRIAHAVRNASICALARTVKEDVEAAVKAVENAERPRIHVFVATSDVHVEKKLRKSRNEVHEMIFQEVSRAKAYCDDVEFSPEDASRTSWEDLAQAVAIAIDAGATTINIPDTVGYAVPWEFEERLKLLYQRVPGLSNVVLSVHCHNDLGLAVANTLAGVRAGARQVEGCFVGIGERAGNVALEAVVMAIAVRQDQLCVETGVDTKKLGPLCRFIAGQTGCPIPMHHPIVGSMAFAHSSGIHRDGVNKDSRTYEIMAPEDVGWIGEEMKLVSHLGRNGLKRRLDEIGYDGSMIIEEVYGRFTDLADQKGELTDEDLHMIAQEALVKKEAAEENLFWLEMDHVQYGPGFGSVIVTKNGESHREAGCGDGPIDALYVAIQRAVAKHGVDVSDLKLISWSAEKGRGGSEANAWIEVKLGLSKYVGHARSAHPDTVKAAARAYVKALNQLLCISGLL